MALIKNKAYVFIGFAFLFNNFLLAHEQEKTDSLIFLLKSRKISDSAKFSILTDVAFNYNNPDSSLFYAEQLIDFAKVKSNQKYLAKGYYIKGLAFKFKGNLEEAIKSFFFSAQYSKNVNYINGLGNSYVALGDVYLYSKNHSNAFFYYNKAIKIFRDLKDSIPLASVLLNCGNGYLSVNILDTALLYLNESLDIFKIKNFRLGIAYCLGNSGRIYSKLGNDSLAELKIISAIEILEKAGDKYALASYKRYLAYIYRDKKNILKALIYANQSLKIASDAGLTPQIRDACDLLAELYSKTGDYSNAYNYYKKYISYRDSINNEETIRKMADLRTEYEVAQKQSEVDLLIKKRKVTRAIAAGLIVLVLLSGALILILYRNYKRKKSLNKLLLEQKEELMAQQEQLAELNRTKDRFFSIISHDLRGPIGAIGNFPILFKEYIELNDINELSELIVYMDSSVQKVSNLLDNLLEWALSQQGAFPYRPEKVQLNNLITEIYSIFSNMAETKGIKLVEEVKEELFVEADKNSLMTIIRNLLNNAIKFTPQGGVITIKAVRENDDALLTVSDTGVGMPEEKLNSLFQLSEKKSTWGTDNEKGLGIGLSLVHEFVRMNNGTIHVESKVGEGTSFFVRIPVELN